MGQLSDLNLLPALHILLQERHISRAAQRAGLSQPAMSRVLGKLRQQFHDDLLVRTGTEYQLTPKASHLKQQLNSLIPELEQLHQSEAFSPCSSDKMVRIAGTDMDVLMLTDNIHRIQTQAPKLSLSFKQTNMQITDQVLNGDLDFAITAANDDRAGLHRIVLWRQAYAVVVDKNSPLSADNFTLDDYLAHRHGAYNLSDVHRGPVDFALAQLNCQRKITLRLPTFIQIPALLAKSDLMFSVPDKFAEYLAKHHSVKILPLPFDVQPFNIYLYWHHRLHNSQLHKWLRDALIPDDT
ncbi:LysR family transcriptional regulator [Thalassotalea fusca]